MTTTEFVPNTPVTSVADPGRGVGNALRMWGNTEVEVQWSGVPITRREPVGDVERYVPPAPVKRVRRSRRAA